MSRIEDEINDRINYIILKEVEKRCYEIQLKNKELKDKYDWLWKIYTSEVNELKKENRKLEETLEHRDSFFSIMRDVLANEDIDNTKLVAILYCVIHNECWDTDLSKKELEIAKRFWKRKYC